MNSLRTSIGVLLLCAVFQLLAAQDVLKYAGRDTSLGGRWAWAVGQANRDYSGANIWIGYSIKRLMDEDAYLKSGNFMYGTVGSRRSLGDVLGMNGVSQSRASSFHAAQNSSVFKRMKDVAVLVLYSVQPGKDPVVQNVELCDLELSEDLKNHPVYWLGGSDDDQSVRFLIGQYGSASTANLKKRLVTAIGVHQRSQAEGPFLSSVVKDKEPDEVRAKAVFWLGDQRNPELMSTMMDLAQNDRSQKVREQAVFAVSQIDDEQSTDALITLVKSARDARVRARAAFWLGQKASQKAVTTLEDVVEGDDVSDVQRQALYALSQLKDNEGIERLIRIARTHQNPRVRKLAIQILGQSDDPRALDALIEIARK